METSPKRVERRKRGKNKEGAEVESGNKWLVLCARTVSSVRRILMGPPVTAPRGYKILVNMLLMFCT